MRRRFSRRRSTFRFSGRPRRRTACSRRIRTRSSPATARSSTWTGSARSSSAPPAARAIIVRPDTWVTGELATVGMASAPPPPPPANGTRRVTARERIDGAGAQRRRHALARARCRAVQLNASPSRAEGVHPVLVGSRLHVQELPPSVRVRAGGDVSSRAASMRCSRSRASSAASTMRSSRTSRPTAWSQPYPVDEVEFQPDAAYAIYNWELFFHMPLLIATRLSANQRFEDAQRWFHYIFDPTGDVERRGAAALLADDAVPRRARPATTSSESVAEPRAASRPEATTELCRPPVSVWRDNPFNPHRGRAAAHHGVPEGRGDEVPRQPDRLGRPAVPRTTPSSRSTRRRSCTCWPRQILGRRPEVITRRVHAGGADVQQPDTELDAAQQRARRRSSCLSRPRRAGARRTTAPNVADPPQTLYFCVPANDKLLGYWDTVADRLFKIRHCMNIEGAVRQLPLFEPPIDPALLVRARGRARPGRRAQRPDAPLPHYRFSVMLQKANELAAEVRRPRRRAALGAGEARRRGAGAAALGPGAAAAEGHAGRASTAGRRGESERSTALQKDQELGADARRTTTRAGEFMNADETAGSSGAHLEHARSICRPARRSASSPAMLADSRTSKLGSPTTAGAEVGGD